MHTYNDFERMMARSDALMDEYPIIPVMIGLFFLGLLLLKIVQKVSGKHSYAPCDASTIYTSPNGLYQQKSSLYTSSNGSRQHNGSYRQGTNDLLSQAIYRWSPHDPLTIRDLTRSIAVIGGTGSGKTTGSGAHLGFAMARHPKISILALSSKPEDRGELWERIYAQAGRQKDLLVFGPESPLRCNIIDVMQAHSADDQDIAKAISTIGETLQRNDSSSREDGNLWKNLGDETLYNAVVIVRLATGKVSAPVLHQFINGAAQSVDELHTEGWQNGFHNRCLRAASNAPKTPIQQHDCSLALQYWLKQFPRLADRTRSSVLIGVMNTLHVFNIGMVRELLSTTTNVTPEVLEHGKSLLIDMPISTHGVAGAFVLGAWKYLTQWYILKRRISENSPVIVIWSDENQKVVNSNDPPFLAECRSHRGCMVVLTQSMHSYYTKLRQGGEHEADSFLTNFHTKIFHALGDEKTAAYASSLIGRRLITRVNSSTNPVDNAFDSIFGQSRTSASTNQSIENIVEAREFMQNLRTGGRENRGIVDGIVVRSGQPFSNGEAFLKVSFKQ